MLEYKWINKLLKEVKYSEVKLGKRGRASYIDLSCGFDIETTSTYTQDGSKLAFMYIWMLGIGHGHPVYYGRTWEEFVETAGILQSHFGLTRERRLVVYVHNLAFEFQFMRKYFQWHEVFASADRKPLKAVTTGGIEFRDSLILSGHSLAGTARNLVKYKVTKAEGDLDYSLVRHHETPLTAKEMGYCRRDIEVVTAYIEEQREIYGDVSAIPMTNTGRVRAFTRDKCFGSNKARVRTGSNGGFAKYSRIMAPLKLDKGSYEMSAASFAGGFTHASPLYCGKTLEGVSSYDFTSSYPAVMVTEMFPMTPFKACVFDSIGQLNRMVDDPRRAVMFSVRFTGLRTKISQELYLSVSKGFEVENPVTFNGRIAAADVYATDVIDTDWKIIRECYEWDTIQISNSYYAGKGYLPKPIIEACAELYIKKTVLKGVEGAEAEYMVSKGMLNSLYGMCVTSIVQDDTLYDENDEWSVSPADMLESLDRYNNQKMRFLYYPWGVWITGYARLNLWSGILAIGKDYVYSDTDSIKLLNHQNHKEYFENYDREVLLKIERMFEKTGYAIDRSSFNPKTQKGEEKPIGVWDYEGTYDLFKTLGAKRYLTLKGEKLELTVAGVGKKDGGAYLEKLGGGNYVKIFNEIFTDNLYFPAGSINKLTHTYIDERMDVEVVDYQGRKAWVHPESGVHLSQCDFTLSMAVETIKFLEGLERGELWVF